MVRILVYIVAFGLALHGLIHLLGLVAYWPLGTLDELPYKTTLLNGQWDVGRIGMRLFSLLWLIAGVGFVLAALGLVMRWPGWQPLLIGALLLSLLITVLDWSAAYRGAVIDLVILVWLVIVPRLTGWFGGVSS